MLVWYDIEASCPVCASRLRIRQMGGGFALGQDSDLLVRMEGKHVVQEAIHTCLRCRFSGYGDDFAANIARPLAKRFLAELTPELVEGSGKRGTTPLPDTQYYWAYRAGAFLGRAEGELGERLLRAYWCLRLPPSSDLPASEADQRRRRYLEGAIHHFRQGARANAAPVWLYLLGELNRKCGEYPAAVGYFKRFLETSSEGGVPRYLRLAAIKLLQAAEHHDGRDRTMEEIVYAES